MKKNNRRTAKVIFMAFVLGLLLSIAGTAFASSFAGTSSDPLVSQSWVEEYLNSHFSALEKEVDAIGVAVQEALGLSQVDIVLTIGSANATVNGAAKTIDADNSRVVPPWFRCALWQSSWGRKSFGTTQPAPSALSRREKLSI